jgi:hypothetical protein
MGIRKATLAAAASAAAVSFMLAQPAHAVVATISGSYDLLFYDTIGLTFHNTSGGTLTNSKMVLHGYQGLNAGTTQTVNLGDLGAGDTNFVWGFLPGGAGCCGVAQGDLTSYDYDDSWGNTPAGYTNPDCVIVAGLCSQVGNFSITYTAKVSGGAFDGLNVFSVFSPASNFTGSFVGFEGLTPDGVSESIYDQHQGSITGTLAVIDVGVPKGTVPEPSVWAMLIAGFAGMGSMLRFRRRATA